MNEQNFTSSKLSRRLYEAGCKLESKEYYIDEIQNQLQSSTSFLINSENITKNNSTLYPKYDILNDICCRYARQFFCEEEIEVPFLGTYYYEQAPIHHAKNIVVLMQQGKKEEVEEYILNHSVFFLQK